MKKFLVSALLVLTALTSAMADGPGMPISLIKKPKPTDPTPVPVPGIDPLNLTEDDDNFFTLEAALSNYALSLTASSAIVAQVTIVSESGYVLYEQLEVLGNVPTEVSTVGWASGSCTLYITIGDDLYEGSFLL